MASVTGPSPFVNHACAANDLTLKNPSMSGFKDLAKGGWHPKGKDGGKESWKGDFKGVQTVVRHTSSGCAAFMFTIY